jgi:hypothetical protein
LDHYFAKLRRRANVERRHLVERLDASRDSRAPPQADDDREGKRGVVQDDERASLLPDGAPRLRVEEKIRPCILPFLMPAVTDGRFFARLGIQTYGFLPMRLPAELRFMELVHAEDERIPVDAVDFGTTAIGRLIGQLR